MIKGESYIISIIFRANVQSNCFDGCIYLYISNTALNQQTKKNETDRERDIEGMRWTLTLTIKVE